MTNTGDINHPLIALVCIFGYIIVSCVLIWLTCFITALLKGRKADADDLVICLLWPIFVVISPFVVVVMLWQLLRFVVVMLLRLLQQCGFRGTASILARTANILILPFCPTEFGLRLYIRHEIRRSTKLEKKEKTNE